MNSAEVCFLDHASDTKTCSSTRRRKEVKLKGGGRKMKGILFVVLWIGFATLHTLYELKIKPFLDSLGKDSKDIPFQ